MYARIVSIFLFVFLYLAQSIASGGGPPTAAPNLEKDPTRVLKLLQNDLDEELKKFLGPFEIAVHLWHDKVAVFGVTRKYEESCGNENEAHESLKAELTQGISDKGLLPLIVFEKNILRELDVEKVRSGVVKDVADLIAPILSIEQQDTLSKLVIEKVSNHLYELRRGLPGHVWFHASFMEACAEDGSRSIAIQAYIKVYVGEDESPETYLKALEEIESWLVRARLPMFWVDIPVDINSWHLEYISRKIACLVAGQIYASAKLPFSLETCEGPPPTE